MPALGGAIGLAGLLSMALAGPTAAAECALSAPESVSIGSVLAIDGTGFTASSMIDVAVTLDGQAADAFPASSDATGAIHLSLTPEATDAGRTTFVATDPGGCSAQATTYVLGPGQTVPPGPEPAGTGAHAAAGAPSTDATARPFALWTAGTTGALAAVLVVVGLAARAVSRPAGRR
jgi:hypothetical protein